MNGSMAMLLVAVATSAVFHCAADPQNSNSVATPRSVALVVQNHTSDAPTLPMSALADTLASRLTGDTLSVVDPQNVIGTNQNRTAKGEKMPEVPVRELGLILKTDGVVTASVQEFSGEDILFEGKAVAHTLKVRLALNLMDTATGKNVCGIDGVEFSENVTTENLKSNTATLYEGLMHQAAAKAAVQFLAKVKSSDWRQTTTAMLDVFFGCNVPGADVQIDGLSRGTCPMQLKVSPGVHSVLVSYPPYYYNFERVAHLDQEGQMFKVVLQLTPEGEEQRNRALKYAKDMAALNNEQRTADFEYERDMAELEADKNLSGLEYDKKKLELENKRETQRIELEKKRKNIDIEIAENAELFKKQLAFIDANLEQYKLSGETKDYVCRKLADGVATCWGNSYGRIAITEGTADNIRFALPSTGADDLTVPTDPEAAIQAFHKLLMKRCGR